MIFLLLVEGGGRGGVVLSDRWMNNVTGSATPSSGTE